VNFLLDKGRKKRVDYLELYRLEPINNFKMKTTTTARPKYYKTLPMMRVPEENPHFM
jgi:hypothetical protein